MKDAPTLALSFPEKVLNYYMGLDVDQRNILIANMLGEQLFFRVCFSVGKRLVGSSPTERCTPANKKAAIEIIERCRADVAYRKKIGKNLEVKGADLNDLNGSLEIWAKRYSDTPGGAWVVVEKMKEMGFSVVVRHMNGLTDHPDWIALVGNMEVDVSAMGDTMPEAVCEAFIKLVSKTRNCPGGVLCVEEKSETAPFDFCYATGTHKGMLVGPPVMRVWVEKEAREE